MHSLSEAEARQLLSTTWICEEADPDDWLLLDKPQGMFSFEQGLVNEDGEGAGLFVQLLFYRSPETHLITLKMSVFQKIKRQDPQRVYQLHVMTQSYKPQNWHDRAHEHFGDGRSFVPDSDWQSWRNFTDVIHFFCQQTNIQFRPPLDDPEQLRLKP